MKSRSIGAVRRSELSRAAFQAVVQYGLRGTTLERVSEIAGVSKGVVLHHFKDKSNLLEAVFRSSNGILSDCVIELYRHAQTPHERLWAIIVANFNEAIFNSGVCQACVSLLGEVPHSAQCQRIQCANNARIHNNLVHELKHFLDEEEARCAARMLGLVIDGIWSRSGARVEELDSSKAISDMEYALTKLLPNDSESVLRHKEARRKIEAIADIALRSKAFEDKVPASIKPG